MRKQVRLCCFPNLDIDTIISWKYLLMKYRGGFYPPPNMPSSEFLYIVKRIERDINDKSLDPYMYKYSMTPPRS